LFGLNVITVNPRLFTGNEIFKNIFVVICSLEEILEIVTILGTDFAQTRCIPKSSVKIEWYEPMDIPTSRTVSRRFSLIMLFIWEIIVTDLKVKVGHTAHHHMKFLHFSNVCPFVGRRLTQDIIAVSFMQHTSIMVSEALIPLRNKI
jgi:hypothetical protein